MGLWKVTLDIWGNRELLLMARVVGRKTDLMYGFGNRCKDGKYCLFLDYDSSPIEWVKEEITLLQDKFYLGTAYIFKTKRGLHVVFLDKMLLGEVVRIMDCTSCDKHYKDIPLYYGKRIWVLRSSSKNSEKIEFIGTQEPHTTIPDEYRAMKSRAHMLYMMEVYNIHRRSFPPDEELDDAKELTIGYYKIAKENN